ncbi:MAG: glycosyltransferase family 39 protein [Candidatus Latescibacteria bacterium]|nr:glycosyltransferase family 39 protein [Candidatus Latescibacterota bacterium]
MKARLPLLLFALALAVRLAYVLQEYPVPPQDTPDYDEIALNLLKGEGFVARENWFGFEMRSWRAPFYPFFLAAVYGVCGHSHLAVKAVQAVVGAGTVALLYGLGLRIWPAAALGAGLFAAVYGPLVVSAGEVMSETWFTFWLVLAAYLLNAPAGRLRDWLGGGVAIGLAALTRPVGLLLWPALALVALLGERREGLRRSLWVGLALGATILPWTVRNYLVHQTWVPISTHGGFILARSNAAQPDWRREQGWGIARETFVQIPSEVERDRHWQRQGLDFIRTHPGTYLRWSAERFLRFWYFFQPGYNFWFALLLPFLTVGLWHYGRREGFLLLSVFFGISLAAFCLVLYGSVRFRLPLEPFFILFAAAAAEDLVRRQGRRGWLLLGGAVVANLILYWQDEALRALVLEWLHRWQLK